jgi:hypothetical protein
VPRYAVVFHDHPAPHWDLFLERGGVLQSWRLFEQPLPGATVRCEPAAEHRIFYLDYEGPVSGGRGTVTRVAAGEYECLDGRILFLEGHYAGELRLRDDSLTLGDLR